MVLSYPHDVISENIATTPSGPDEPYLTVTISLTPEEAATMLATLDSNNATARAARDPLARAILEAIQNSDLYPS